MSAAPDLTTELAVAAEPAPVPRAIAPDPDASALRAARLRRKLSAEEVAARAGLFPEEVRWLEEGRVYRFRSPEDAVLAAILYGTAVGIDRREARALAGFTRERRIGRRARGAVLAALAVALAVAVAMVVPSLIGGDPSRPQPVSSASTAALGASLPPPATITVDVLNGTGDINWTQKTATSIAALGYKVGRITKATRFDYRRTVVYFEPGGQALAERLARSLGVLAQPLPGGTNPRRLVVIVGPQSGPG